jgi:hypothetical protein
MSGSKGSWVKTQEAMDSQGSSTFLRLENDGDKAVVVFCAAPFHRDICFNEKTGSYEAWDDAAKAAGRKKSSRYAMNVYVVAVKGVAANEMKVLDMNFNTMKTVIGLKDKYTLVKHCFEIVRHGAKGDTKTQYQILPDKEISAELRAACGSPDPNDSDSWVEGTAKLIDLDEATAKGGEDGGGATVSDDVKKDKKPKPAANGTTTTAAATASPASALAPGEATISKAVKDEIIEKLKPLDREKGVGVLLARFAYAKKVSEIRASDEAAARKLASELAAPPPAANEDPFA